jgi:protein-S-isoprenylcysteine O-methyltransferase Ste14
MKVQGLESLVGHVPELRTLRGWLRALLDIVAVFVLTTLFFMAADRYFPEWMPDGEIVILALGFLLLSRFFSQTQRYRQMFGEGAYLKAFERFSLPGVGIITASIAHLAYIAGPDLPGVWWRAWLIALGYVLVIVGVLIWWRAVTSAGIDCLLMLYVYFPSEGSEIRSGIYSVVRHPIYAAAQNIGFGLALIHANWYAFLVALLLPLFFAGWVRLFEEPELLQRFPDYAEYRKRVPAFGPAPANIPKFGRFLLIGSAQRTQHELPP